MSLRSPIAPAEPIETLVDTFLAEQRRLTAVERFAQRHAGARSPRLESHYRDLLPLSAPQPGEQFAFEVDLDRCSSCKACVSACHSLNGLDDEENWREVKLLVGQSWSPRKPATAPAPAPEPLALHVTAACHHCADPACLHGCPVLAYHKDPLTGIVHHLDDQCIGCSYCILKCPYEVPRYSPSRGIVRKCDLCRGRLDAGEAPACVQACPNEAIRITLVPRATPGTGNIPGFPDPAITRPTTRYISRHSLDGLDLRTPAGQAPASPHWPLVWMLVLTQFGGGLLAARPLPGSAPSWIPLLGWLLFHAGLVASVFHLGRPSRAWRIWMGWRSSWLSREALVLGAVSALDSAAVACHFLPGFPATHPALPLLVAAGVFTGLAAATFAQVGVYVDTRRPAWRWQRTVPRFLSTVAAGAFTGHLAARFGPVALLAGLVLIGFAVRERRAFFQGMRDGAGENGAS